MTNAWLVFRLGPYVMCASALDVEGIIRRPEGLTKFPLTPGYALGAFLFRGRSAAAISLRTKLNVRQSEDSATGPFIVARVGEGLTAFWVDEVKDVIDEKDAEWRPMPPMLEGGLFQRFGLRDRDLILQTSFAALRETDAEFEPVASWVATQVPAPPALEAAPVKEAPKPLTPGVAPKERLSEGSAAMVPPPAFAPIRPIRQRPALRNRTDAQGASLAPVARGRTPILPVEKPVPLSYEENPLPAHDSAAEPHAEERISSVANHSAARRIAIPASIAVIALAALIYGLLPPTSPATQPTSISNPTTPVIDQPQPAAKPVASPEPRTLVLTIEQPSGKAASPVTRVHTVVRGDTLWDIARKQVGDPFQYPELAKLSNISNPNLIHPGDTVRIEVREAK